MLYSRSVYVRESCRQSRRTEHSKANLWLQAPAGQGTRMRTLLRKTARSWTVLQREVCPAQLKVVDACDNIWHCISVKGCYVDIRSSSCGQPGAVRCSQLAEGVEGACCPQFTTCTKGNNASATFVPCDIPEDDLKALASSGNSTLGADTNTIRATSSDMAESSTSSDVSAKSSSTTTSTRISSQSLAHALTGSEPIGSAPSASNATIPPLDATPTALPPSTSGHLSGAAITGIAIGPVLFVLLVAAMVWLLWRRRSRKKLGRGLSQPQGYSATSDPGVNLHSKDANSLSANAGKTHEVHHEQDLSELSKRQTSPRELQAKLVWPKAGWVKSSPVELEGSWK